MHSKKLTAIILGLVALALGVFISLQMQPKPRPQGYPGLGGDFTLQSSKGNVSLSDFNGKLVALYFGYTYCPDVCPTSLASLGQALKKFDNQQQSRIQPVFITVDPERDTPERMAEYSAHFHPNMVGLTGDLETIKTVAKKYGVFFAKANMGDSAVDYAMDHSSIIFVIDGQGVVQKLIKHTDSPQNIYQSIKQVLEVS